MEVNQRLETDPLVSVWMVTYNHEKYIGQALDGVIMQETTFPFEIVIGEDCSTDRTRSILEAYIKKYPGKIFPIYQKKNVGGFRNAYEFTLPHCRGKYIACLEGDDYWTDQLKLQKQVDFLEANPRFVFSFHDACILNQKTGEERNRIGERKIDSIVDLKSLIIQNNIPTASLVFRNILDYTSLPDWFSKISKGDYGLCVLLAEKGSGKYIPDVMSVYRVHDGGVWSSSGFEFTKNADLSFYKYLSEYFDNQEIKETIRAKLKWTRFNYGINHIRQGRLTKGLFLAVTNLRLKGDSRLRTKPRKIGSALKSRLVKN